jgi:hypothetical protein
MFLERFVNGLGSIGASSVEAMHGCDRLKIVFRKNSGVGTLGAAHVITHR